MGGENSEIVPETKTIVFESANFNGPSVRVTARDIGLRTEASGRYEKGLDRENTLPATTRLRTYRTARRRQGRGGHYRCVPGKSTADGHSV